MKNQTIVRIEKEITKSQQDLEPYRRVYGKLNSWRPSFLSGVTRAFDIGGRFKGINIQYYFNPQTDFLALRSDVSVIAEDMNAIYKVLKKHKELGNGQTKET
ncbi:MAG: hypothetical protein IEMM0008_1525 [bacterium]|nr:MAG: hypothetical protein IEMM0008_1525 [bacterium]